MIRDLAQVPGEKIRADVAIVGGGIAGLLLAVELARRSVRVVVIESGAEDQNTETHPLNEVEQLGSTYAGARDGRFRCLGGTSTRWGGALIPFQAADMEQAAGAQWPVSHAELTRYLPALEALLDLPDTPYDVPQTIPGGNNSDAAFVPRLAKWPPFAFRNMATLFRKEIRSLAGLEIWLNATATNFVYAADGSLAELAARSEGGHELSLEAGQFVLTAGAIESTRLLLLADRAADNRIFASQAVLGRYFHDHLSVEVAKVVAKDCNALNRIFGFRFERGAMRNLRFEPASDSTHRRELAPCFAHVGFDEQAGGGFDALREAYRQVQRRRIPAPATVARLSVSAPWLLRAAWWRFARHRLLFPDGADLNLQMVIEQVPRQANRIALSQDRTDCFGLPLASIDWCVGACDRERLEQCTTAFFDYWRRSSLSGLANLQTRDMEDAAGDLVRGGGIYHPGGSTRMGRDAGEGVVDSDLRCFGIPNLSVAATSTFPTGGGANPTMMLMLATLRLADRLSMDVR